MPTIRLNEKQGMVLAYVLLTALSIVPVWLGRPLVDAARLHYQGVVTEGRILARDTTHHPQRSIRGHTMFTGTVAYTADGMPVEAKILLENRYADDFTPGAPVTIRYLPGEPRTFSVEGMPLDAGKRTAEVLVMSAFVSALWFGLWRYRTPNDRALALELEQSGYLSRRGGLPRS